MASLGRTGARRIRPALVAAAATCALLTLALPSQAAPAPAAGVAVTAPRGAARPVPLFTGGRVASSLVNATGVNLVHVADKPPAGLVPYVRLWGAGVSWSDIERTPGVYTWGPLDDYVAWANANRAKVLLVLGPSPAFYSPLEPAYPWAFNAAKGPPKGRTPWASYLTAWSAYVKAVAQRYNGSAGSHGTIESYEIWNEANLTSFYSGTYGQVVAMTKSAYVMIHRYSPRALVTSPSASPSARVSTNEAVKLTLAFKAAGWPFDVYNIHAYPHVDGSAASVGVNLAWYTSLLRQLKAPRKPVWDTETNLNRWHGKAAVSYTADQTTYAMTRVTTDALAAGVSRVYWWFWGMGPTEEAVPFRPDGNAAVVLSRWGTRSTYLFTGCRATARARTCTFAHGRTVQKVVLNELTRTAR